MSEYVRTRGGRTFHRSTCRVLRRVKTVHEWKYAEGKTVKQILTDCLRIGINVHPCRVCIPLWGLAA